MKTRLLIIIGIAVIGVFMILSFSNEQQNTCEQIGGTWNSDYCMIKQETFDSNKLTCDPGPVFEDGICQSNGIKLVFEPVVEPESFTKIEIMSGEQLNDKLVPVTFTEVTTHAETLDEIIVWNFKLIGHSADDRRVVWDALPKDKRIGYEITNNDGLDISIPENFISIPLDIHGYKMNCGLFQTVEGESAHPTLLQIKSNKSTIYAQNSRIGIYPDSNGEYSFEFASIFKNYVSFPEDAVEIMSRETRACKLTHNVENDLTGKYTDGYYTKMTFRFN